MSSFKTAITLLLSVSISAHAVIPTYDWNSTTGGDWGEASNWHAFSTPAPPNASDAEVTFSNFPSEASTIDLQGNTFDVNMISFFNDFSIDIANGTLDSVSFITNLVSSPANTISADIQASTLVVYPLSANPLTISGNISATELEKQLGGKLILTGTNTFSEAIGIRIDEGEVEATTNSANTNVQFTNTSSGIFTLNQDFAGTFTGDITETLAGDHQFMKKGSGSVTLSGTHTYSGDTSVLGGTLRNDGDLTSTGAIIVNGGTLTGDGTFAPTTLTSGRISGNGTYNGIAVNGGVISPGDSIGIINVAGNYFQASGGVYEVELQGSSSDQIIATGSATIDAGAIITLVPEGSFFSGSTYDLLEAPGVINQLWSVENAPSDFDYQISLVNGNTIARLTILSTILFQGKLIDPGNNTAVYNYMNTLNVVPDTDLFSVVAAMDTLNDLQLNEALSQLHPALFGAFELANLDNNTLITRAYSNRFGLFSCDRCDPCAPKNNAWISPFGNFSYMGKYDQLREFRTSTGGFIVGVDRNLGCGFYGGVGGGYSFDCLEWGQSAGNAEIHKGFGALYAGYLSNCFLVNAVVMGGGNCYDVTRKISFSTIDRKAVNTHNSGFATVHLGLDAPLCSDTFLFDFFGMGDYCYLYQPGYTEKGAESLNLKVRDKDSHLFRVEAGCRVGLAFNFCSGTLTPYLALSWVEKIPVGQDTYVSQFADYSSLSSVLVVDTFHNNRDFGSTELGFNYCQECVNLSLLYKGEFAKHYWVNQVVGQIGMNF